MKALSIRQPWASIICAGIKDVENRSWKTNYRGKLLIHSSSYKCPKGYASLLPLEMGSLLLNQDTFGNFDLDDVPSGAIIGYVDLVDCVEGDYNSIWADKDSVKFVLQNAYMFDEPITGVKGKLNIFDYDLNEDNLPPAHQVKFRIPYTEGDEFVLPVSNTTFDNCLSADGILRVDLYETLDSLEFFTDYNEADNTNTLKNFDNIKTLLLVAEDDREKAYKFIGVDWIPVKDQDDNTIVVPDINGEDREVWAFALLFE